MKERLRQSVIPPEVLHPNRLAERMRDRETQVLPKKGGAMHLTQSKLNIDIFLTRLF